LDVNQDEFPCLVATRGELPCSVEYLDAFRHLAGCLASSPHSNGATVEQLVGSSMDFDSASNVRNLR
jgi:hypothetical protein